MATMRVASTPDASRMATGARLSRSSGLGGELDEYAQMFEELFGEDMGDLGEGFEGFDWEGLWADAMGAPVEEEEQDPGGWWGGSTVKSHIVPGYRSGIYY